MENEYLFVWILKSSQVYYCNATCTFCNNFQILFRKNVFLGSICIVLIGHSKNIYLQVLNEVKKTRKWAALHVADNCCFHYRRVSFVNCLVIIQYSNYFEMTVKFWSLSFFPSFQRLMLKILEDTTCTEISSGLSVDIYQMWKVNFVYPCLFSNRKIELSVRQCFSLHAITFF